MNTLHNSTTHSTFTIRHNIYSLYRKLEIYKSLQITTQNFECLIIQMQNYIVLFTLIIFSSVVFPGIQEVLNVPKCIADIHQELPYSCVSS